MSGNTNSFSSATLTDSSLKGTTSVSGTVDFKAGTVVTGLFKRHIGLQYVDNTSDALKPLSGPQKQYIDGKVADITGFTTQTIESLNSIGEIAGAINNDPSFFTNTSNALALKAPLANPVFTGSVRLPTGQGILKSTATGTVSSSAVTQSDLDTALVSRLSSIDTAIAALQAFDVSFVATSDRIQDGAITTAKIADANVTTAKIADASVTTAKIADANVTTAKIADANVTTAKIADANVTTAKIADGAVFTSKLGDASVTSNKLASSLNLTGTPVAPTAADSTNTTQIATTAFVQKAVSNLVGTAPELLNTLGEISSAIKGDANFNDTMVGLLALKAASADVYTKIEADNLLGAKAASADVYTKSAADGLLAAKAASADVYTKIEADNLLGAKAASADVYTKTEADDLLDAKAASADVYTKSAADGLLGAKANSADVYTKTEANGLLADKADSTNVYTKIEADALLGAKAASADVYTKIEADALLGAKAAASTVSEHAETLDEHAETLDNHAIKLTALAPILPANDSNDDFRHVFVEATTGTYADAQPPMALPSARVGSTMNHTSHRLLKGRGLHGNRDGWYFRNTAGAATGKSGNNKINWYYPSPKNASGVSLISGLDEIVVPLQIFMSASPALSILPPQITVYTKPKGDGQDFSWYRTRRTYMISTSTTLTANSKYLFRCLVNGSSLTGTFDTEFTTVDLEPLRSTLGTTIVDENGAIIRSEAAMTATSVIRPFEAEEEVMFVAIGSDSSGAAGRCEFFMHNVIMLGSIENVMYHHSNENAAVHYFSRKITDICKATTLPIPEYFAL
jgi:hypothetical protein